jgi:hypothetical protein
MASLVLKLKLVSVFFTPVSPTPNYGDMQVSTDDIIQISGKPLARVSARSRVSVSLFACKFLAMSGCLCCRALRRGISGRAVRLKPADFSTIPATHRARASSLLLEEPATIDVLQVTSSYRETTTRAQSSLHERCRAGCMPGGSPEKQSAFDYGSPNTPFHRHTAWSPCRC